MSARLVLTGLLAFFLFGCQGEQQNGVESQDTREISVGTAQGEAVPVSAIRATRDTMVQYISTIGTFQPLKSTTIVAPVEGRVASVLMKNGIEVKTGDLLLQLHTAPYQDKLIRARSTFIRSLSAAVQEFRADSTPQAEFLSDYLNDVLHSPAIDPLPLIALHGNKEIPAGLKAGLGSGLGGDSDSGALVFTNREYMVLARHDVPGAYADVRQAERDLTSTEIRAPFSGILFGVTGSGGELIQTGAELATLTSLDTLQVAIDILESNLRDVTPGTPFRILANDGSVIARGKIDGISPAIDEETRTAEAFAILPNPDHLWKASQHLQIEVRKARFPDRLVVPKEAVLTRNERDLVFIVQDGLAKWRYIETGPENKRMVSIQSGIAPGDTVIVRGHYTLAHDSPVNFRMVNPNKIRQSNSN
ncbi:MAG: efflux RND transporter periplasmic adaptor subunit [Candidatus Marinimicrobia bacterium]|nr:efflux RND transporter periplasmic adaptor subunit [Candidatus Neomarinimicrobiota bacterium]MCF7829463.1 efflux RND transporter periplasmic adaptor subunit [Candidatus Neomarinimicrobiota bacterium]MCF7882342.1 efflux RND transporter periplasmic adaptor subunit [Candidatus Neomarinimicrobiota bacterium]